MNVAIPFLVAMQFLTRVPVPLRLAPTDRQTGASLAYYPIVGVLLGLVLAALFIAMETAPSLLRAGLTLLGWVLLTGAMHLDGLADSVDAWIGGNGNRSRTLSIMKDPHCGPMGVVALMLTLLIKFAALSALPVDSAALLLIFVPMYGRAAAALLLISTPYVRPGGLGAALSANALPKTTLLIIGMFIAVSLVAALDKSVMLLLSTIIVFVVARFAMVRRLGGTTGDSTGALIEIVETIGLFVVVLTI